MATKRKPTPAQIAARERFAEMARSGAFKKKATKARKKNPRASNPIILVSDKPVPTKRKRNPQAPSIKRKGVRNIAYAVEAKRMLAGGGAQFEMIAGFPTKAQAQDYIDALLKSYPKGLTLRISAA
jgi:hypothetical protein